MVNRVRQPKLISLAPRTIEELERRRAKTGIPVSRQLENAFWKKRGGDLFL